MSAVRATVPMMQAKACSCLHPRSMLHSSASRFAAGQRLKGWQQHQRQRVRRQQQQLRQLVQASVFGVGAPEAVLVGIVALVVFGPKGLAEAAKGLGRSLRGLQPTIRELAGVSSDLRRTLEQEIGLDELRSEWRSSSIDNLGTMPTSTSSSSTSGSKKDTEDAAATQNGAGSVQGSDGRRLEPVTDSIADSLDPDINQKRAASAAAAWGGAEQHKEPQADAQQPSPGQARAAEPSGGGSSLQATTLEELEAELARRKKQQQGAVQD